MKTSSIKNSTKFPKFMRNSKGFAKERHIKKVFPSIGLNNSSVLVSDIKIDLSSSATEDQDRYRDWADYKLVFASNKRRGVWDIATMSMRGIDSCQSWEGGYRNNLVGSILDPCVGIIYITNKSRLKHGTRMTYRSIVRLVIHKKTKTPKLMLEPMYPRHSRVALALFKQFLSERTQNKFEIIAPDLGYDNYERVIEKHAIPRTKIVDTLTSGLHSYRDSGISYTKKTYNLKVS